MRTRPFFLFACSLLFLYFPLESVSRWWNDGAKPNGGDFLFSFVLPILLILGLIRVTKLGWYTLIALVALWGIRDLQQFYAAETRDIAPLVVHLLIYTVSIFYFITPRVRHLYFDPKQRWWRTKPRYETHLPFLLKNQGEWHYPILRNVSEGGCFVETAHPLSVHEKIHVTIPLPVPLNVSVIKAEGEVRWISKNPLCSGMGVEFREATEPNREALREFVRRKL